MKIAIISLCLLGVVAAACAALLVKGLRPPVYIVQSAPATQPTAVPQVTVLYTTRDLTPMTVVDSSMISTRTMAPEQTPRGYLGDTTDVIGKVIKQPVAAGQAYTAECFFAESGSKLLASVIPPGKRAVAISVTDYAGLDGLIYPGSRVDVLASFKGEGSGDEHHDATTTTLLENVQVLAYEQHTVVSPDKKSLLGDMSDASRSGGMRRVTLLVDTKQSKTLELGAAVGILSLALRNPMDQSATNKDNVTFHSIFGDDQAATPPPPVFTSSAPTTLDKPAQWDMIVMKGGISETRSFILSSGPEGAKP